MSNWTISGNVWLGKLAQNIANIWYFQDIMTNLILIVIVWYCLVVGGTIHRVVCMECQGGNYVQRGTIYRGREGGICPWDFMVCLLFFIEPGCCLVSVVLVYIAVCLDMHVHQTILIYFVVFSGWGEALPS